MDSLASTPFKHGVSRRTFVATIGAGFISLPMQCAWADEPPPKRDPSANAQLLKAARPPEFRRWPPHRPSGRHLFDKISKEYQDLSEDTLLIDIEENLLSLGYPRVYYFGLPDGGSGLALPFERVNMDASPASDDRFNLEPTFKRNFLGRKPVPRHLRAIVLFLTPNRIPAGQSPVNFSKHRAALESGINSLGKGMQFAAITQQHRLTAFLYQYTAEGEEEPTFVPPERSLRGIDQLKASRII